MQLSSHRQDFPRRTTTWWHRLDFRRKKSSSVSILWLHHDIRPSTSHQHYFQNSPRNNSNPNKKFCLAHRKPSLCLSKQQIRQPQNPWPTPRVHRSGTFIGIDIIMHLPRANQKWPLEALDFLIDDSVITAIQLLCWFCCILFDNIIALASSLITHLPTDRLNSCRFPSYQTMTLVRND